MWTGEVVCVYAERGHRVMEHPADGADACRHYTIDGPRADPRARYQTESEAIAALRALLPPLRRSR